MREISKYQLTYKGITCIAVNWETKLFIFRYNGKIFTHIDKRYYHCSADTDHIRMVISNIDKTKIQYE